MQKSNWVSNVRITELAKKLREVEAALDVGLREVWEFHGFVRMIVAWGWNVDCGTYFASVKYSWMNVTSSFSAGKISYKI